MLFLYSSFSWKSLWSHLYVICVFLCGVLLSSWNLLWLVYEDINHGLTSKIVYMDFSWHILWFQFYAHSMWILCGWFLAISLSQFSCCLCDHVFLSKLLKFKFGIIAIWTILHHMPLVCWFIISHAYAQNEFMMRYLKSIFIHETSWISLNMIKNVFSRRNGSWCCCCMP